MIHQFPYQHVHLVGIKGVAMTSLAQILADAEYLITGSDVVEDFVTATQLAKLSVAIQAGFSEELPANTEVVIYTAAHQADQNPQVQQARKKNIPCFSQAEAISLFANSKHCIAVCGVGGKSTVSAMITWILEWNQLHPSFSVGVGNIVGLDRTGAWRVGGHHFVVEADEYVTDPVAVQHGAAGTPRFSYLKPNVLVATNITFDHPDVYRDFDHTKQTFAGFFSKLPHDGSLILTDQVANLQLPLPNCQILHISSQKNSDIWYEYLPQASTAGKTIARLHASHKTYTLELRLPGEYNVQNAVCAVAAATTAGVSIPDALAALKEFKSTQRRFEHKLSWPNAEFYDDYAHHPNELKAVITALKEWYPNTETVIAFQPHTFSRTRSLLADFAESLRLADRLVLLDIFASAREADDPTMTSSVLAHKVSELRPELPVKVLPDTDALAQYFKTQLSEHVVVLTVGAGDIYEVYGKLAQ